ncbi:hypothetical protein TrST_g8377 [Triparma strigata]|uniref:Brix domain-containing protein n=1 Tax=Triparma strigata TaxID=1606541 RepID=A0A9W6ZZS9_9STRA|nr:hypothetical protein TrST_g8377 [Triparma strigata]
MGKSSKKRPASSQGSSSAPAESKKSKLDSAFEAKASQRPMPKIVNKLKRAEIYAKWLKDKKLLKKAVRDAKKESKKSKAKSGDGDVDEAEEFENSEESSKKPKTLENTRESELTLVTPSDTEVLADEEDDEFAPYFSGVIKPKIIVTTRPRPSAELFQFIQSLLTLIPNSYYWPRRDYELKGITEYARNKEFSHLMVLSEKAKVCNGVVVSHLGVPSRSSGIWKGDGQADAEEDWPEDEDEDEDGEMDEMEGIEGEGDGGEGNGNEAGEEEEEDEDEDFDDHADNDEEEKLTEEAEEDSGPRHIPTDKHVLPGPTAFFKINNIVLPKKIANHGAATGHIPELILNNFTTRLGHRAGRFFGSLFPHSPEFKGRQVVTFHNQRDYVFVRHHRYVFKPGTTKADKEKNRTRAELQELGPRFSLRMRWMLSGGFDTKFGEYEWFHKRKEQDTSRRKFHL